MTDDDDDSSPAGDTKRNIRKKFEKALAAIKARDAEGGRQTEQARKHKSASNISPEGKRRKKLSAERMYRVKESRKAREREENKTKAKAYREAEQKQKQDLGARAKTLVESKGLQALPAFHKLPKEQFEQFHIQQCEGGLPANFNCDQPTIIQVHSAVEA